MDYCAGAAGKSLLYADSMKVVILIIFRILVNCIYMISMKNN